MYALSSQQLRNRQTKHSLSWGKYVSDPKTQEAYQKSMIPLNPPDNNDLPDRASPRLRGFLAGSTRCTAPLPFPIHCTSIRDSEPSNQYIQPNSGSRPIWAVLRDCPGCLVFVVLWLLFCDFDILLLEVEPNIWTSGTTYSHSALLKTCGSIWSCAECHMLTAEPPKWGQTYRIECVKLSRHSLHRLDLQLGECRRFHRRTIEL